MRMIRLSSRWLGMNLGFAVAALAGIGTLAHAIDFSQVPSAHSVLESKLFRPFRVNAAIEDVLITPIPQAPMLRMDDLPMKAVAALERGRQEDIIQVNLAYLDSTTVPYAEPGTDFQDLGPLCKRVGDYDFVYATMIRLAAKFWNDSEKLWPKTREKLVEQLITVSGAEHQLKVKLGICGWFDETENHIMLTESTRYLNNQLLTKLAIERGQTPKPEWNNEANGFNRWLVDHMEQFLKHDFFEYNSKPYQTIMIRPFYNLYDFAEDPGVKKMAGDVLNYVSARFAIQSSELRRMPNFRRLKERSGDNHLIDDDSMSTHFAILAGNLGQMRNLPKPFHPNTDNQSWLFAESTTYRIPDPILDLMINKSKGTYFQTHQYDGVEIYFSSPHFLLSAGGIYVPGADAGLDLLNGNAQPSLLIPTNGPEDRREMLRFEGAQEFGRRSNTCVAPNFMCGLQPVIPSSIPDSCKEEVLEQAGGKWTFFNFNSSQCPMNWGLYVAMYTRPCENGACFMEADQFGLMEVVESKQAPFEAFKKVVLILNGGKVFNATSANRYTTSTGKDIDFVPMTDPIDQWGILSYDGKKTNTSISSWPLARGDVMTARGDGRVLFRHPFTGQEVRMGR